MDIMHLLLSPEAWIAFFTLTALELVLGIDNIIFISILVDRLPRETREKARKLGLFMATSTGGSLTSGLPICSSLTTTAQLASPPRISGP